MLSNIFVALTVALSALAYQVTNPTNISGWTSNGPNTLSWNRVDTDASSFAVFLVNQDRTVLPTNNVLLAPSVNGNGGSIVLSSPSGGLPVGNGFQVNFCKDSQSPETILAQSNQFAITAGGSGSGGSVLTTSSATPASGTVTIGTGTNTPSAPSGLSTIVVAPASTTGALNPTTNGTSTNGTHSAAGSGALGFQSFEPCFLGAVALVGALLL